MLTSDPVEKPSHTDSKPLMPTVFVDVVSANNDTMCSDVFSGFSGVNNNKNVYVAPGSQTNAKILTPVVSFSKYKIECMLLNVRSLLSKKDIVQVTALVRFYDICVLNEVKVDMHGKLPSWQEYSICSDVREHGNGGVAVYYHSSVIARRLDFERHDEYECVWMVIGEGAAQITLCAPYIRPGLTEPVKENIFTDLVGKLQEMQTKGYGDSPGGRSQCTYWPGCQRYYRESCG
jgi:hypothetical protein